MVHMLWAVSPRIQNRTSLRKLEENGLGKVGAEGRAGAGPGGGSLWNTYSFGIGIAANG